MQKLFFILVIAILTGTFSCKKPDVRQLGNATFKASYFWLACTCCSPYSLIIDGVSKDSTDIFVPSQIPSNFQIPEGNYRTRVNLRWKPGLRFCGKTVEVLEMTKAE